MTEDVVEITHFLMEQPLNATLMERTLAAIWLLDIAETKQVIVHVKTAQTSNFSKTGRNQEGI